MGGAEVELGFEVAVGGDRSPAPRYAGSGRPRSRPARGAWSRSLRLRLNDQRNSAALAALFIVTRARGAPPRERSSRRCRRWPISVCDSGSGRTQLVGGAEAELGFEVAVGGDRSPAPRYRVDRLGRRRDGDWQGALGLARWAAVDDQRNLAALAALFIVTRARGAPPREGSSRGCGGRSRWPISFAISGRVERSAGGGDRRGELGVSRLVGG